MTTTIIKFLFIYLVCIHIYQKSLNSFKLNLLKECLLSLTLSIIMYITSQYCEWLKYVLPLFLLWIITSVYNHQPQLSFIAITISFTLSFCIYIMISFIVLALLPFFRNSDYYPLLALVTGILQTLLITKLLSTKRFRRGIPFSSTPSITNVATIICILFISFTMYVSIDYLAFETQTIGLFSFIILLAFLIFWWQAQITKSYRKRLELRDQESKRIADLEREIQYQKLLKDHEKMKHITHRDNTLLTTLANATLNYLYTDYANPEEAHKVRDELAANIRALTAERAASSVDFDKVETREFDTNFTLINKLLCQMDADATSMNITFSVHFGVMLDEFVPSTISEIDLAHIVDDLLKNAFKSTRTCEKRMVQLQFYKLGKHFVVEVSDNGIPFEIRSLVNMGIEKLTTYEDGSGIGLVDIWNTKEKYRATYHLDEYATAAPFSKKISLTFDKKNRYSIRTFRKNEILQMSRRADLQVYDYVE